MNITLTIKLDAGENERVALLQTMERFNAACHAIAGVAFANRTSSKFKLQKLVYYAIRQDFGLSAQLTVRAIAKVAEAYKRDRSKQPVFRPLGAVVYDQRSLSWHGLESVSILSLHGRLRMPVVMSAYQAARLDRIRGQVDLVYRDGAFFLAVVADVPEPPPDQPQGWLGVDLGIKNIAADSDGHTYSGGQVGGLRKRHARLRAKLQAKGTRSARRLLKKRRRKEARFARDVNHSIAKRLVAKAKGTRRGIALEDLKGIRNRVTVRKAQRRSHHSWGFHQLRSFLAYKAVLAGVFLVMVDPKNTSRTCPACGSVDKKNRKTQALFCCVGCGFAGPADTIAAGNIARRAAVNRPDASAPGARCKPPDFSPR